MNSILRKASYDYFYEFMRIIINYTNSSLKSDVALFKIGVLYFPSF